MNLYDAINVLAEELAAHIDRATPADKDWQAQDSRTALALIDAAALANQLAALADREPLRTYLTEQDTLTPAAERLRVNAATLCGILDTDLRASQHRTLQALVECGPATVQQIAVHMGIHVVTARYRLGVLAKAGLVSKSRTPDHHGVPYVYRPTPALDRGVSSRESFQN